MLLSRPKARKCGAQQISVSLCVCICTSCTKWVFVWFEGILLLFSGCIRAVVKHCFLLCMPWAMFCPWKRIPANFADARSNMQARAPGCFVTDVTPTHCQPASLPPSTLHPNSTLISCYYDSMHRFWSDQIQMTDYTDFTPWPESMPSGIKQSLTCSPLVHQSKYKQV